MLEPGALLTVHAAAVLLNVSPDTIRRWEKKGLIKASRSKQNYRLFDVFELRQLHNKLNGVGENSEFKILTSKKKTNFRVIELFAGCGGMALGFENAGLKCELLAELDKDCVETLRLNKPNWNVLHSDVATLDFAPYRKKVEIVAGGFPCQAFSYAGNGAGFDDVRGTLFFEFARCVKEVQPKIAVAENVRGLIQHDRGKTLQTMLSILDGLGYRPTVTLLRAQFLDVPQKRERLIILAIRNDLETEPIFPKEHDYTVSLRDALRDCPASEGQSYPAKKHNIMKLVPSGGYWRDLPKKIQKEYMGRSFYLSGGKTGMARRLSWDEPSLTLTCNPAQKQTERCHPSETRPLTVREYARIQSFPDEWNFVGSTASKYRQIGNAVPVNLAYYVGKCLISMLTNEIDTEIMFVHRNRLEQSQLILF